ncbi:TIGR04222 domain-containing membrane protein [Embleya sp. NPDC008237]|uniref:TIGR04222 domain-containing membrane protein n=1 Tax=Embleya sp. NPDC008237 TaxID=3363978 RepID=UPI0036E0E396
METSLFVLLAILATMVLGFRTRQVLTGGPLGRTRPAEPFGAEPLETYELAFLAGGPRQVVDTAIVRLHARDDLRVSRDGRLTTTASTGTGAIEDAVLAAARTEGGADLTEIRIAAARDPAIRTLADRLVAAGLARRRPTPLARRALTAGWVVLVALVWCAALFELGIAIVVGVPVTSAAGVAVFALSAEAPAPATPAGLRCLGRARREWGRRDWDREGPPDAIGGAALFARRGLHDSGLTGVFRGSDARIRRLRGHTRRRRLSDGGGRRDFDPSSGYKPRLGRSHMTGTHDDTGSGCGSSCAGGND